MDILFPTLGAMVGFVLKIFYIHSRSFSKLII